VQQVDVYDALDSGIAIGTLRVALMNYNNSPYDAKIFSRSLTEHGHAKIANACPKPRVSDRFILGVTQTDLTCGQLT
jgi:hypothetical protein